MVMDVDKDESLRAKDYSQQISLIIFSVRRCLCVVRDESKVSALRAAGPRSDFKFISLILSAANSHGWVESARFDGGAIWSVLAAIAGTFPPESCEFIKKSVNKQARMFTVIIDNELVSGSQSTYELGNYLHQHARRFFQYFE